MTCIALIPARGGSKGITRKNIKLFCGKPLIYWTIKIALENKYIDRIIVSTEDQEIAEISKGLGAEVPFLRPFELAKDDTPGIAPVLNTLDNMPNVKDVLLLQPTSPLRRSLDIDQIFKLRQIRGVESAVSLSLATRHPYLFHTIDESHKIKPLILDSKIKPRQQLPKFYTINGALYLSTRNSIEKYQNLITPDTVGYIMPQRNSMDIDTELDWIISEHLMEVEKMRIDNS